MIRIFSILSVLAIIMIIISGGGTYWVSQADITHAKMKSTEAMANGIALGVSSQLSTLQDAVSKMAATPEVINAIESSNPLQLAQTATLLEQFLPNALKIRLLPANIRELDDSNIPHMGNADLIMVQETLTKNQFPAIQGQGENRHLAITAAIKKDNIPIGIVLASLKYDFLQTTFKHSKFSTGFIDLRQGKISLASTGDNSNITATENKTPVFHSSWDVYYWPSISASYESLTVISSIVLILILITGLIFFIYYKKTIQTLKQDQGSILKVVKNLMSGKNVGNYQTNFTEMNTIISTIIQFKRVLDNDGKELSSAEDAEIDSFFDEPTGISFLDMDQETEEDSSTFQSIESSPISFPDLETKENTNNPDSPSAIEPSSEKK
jgi:phosphomannomutase/phosphoglucomutase